MSWLIACTVTVGCIVIGAAAWREIQAARRRDENVRTMIQDAAEKHKRDDS